MSGLIGDEFSGDGDINSTLLPAEEKSAGDIVVDVAAVFVAVVAFYVFIAQFVYCFIWYHRGYDSGGKSKTVSNVLCVFASFATFLRVGVPFQRFATTFTDSICDAFYDFKVSTYAIAYISLWTVLWLRQRYFYHSSVLKKLYSTFIRVVSNGIEVLVVLGVMGSTIQYFVTRSYTADDRGCHEPIDDDSEPYIWAVDFASIFVSQSVLLSLFLYPLWKHQRRLMKNNLCATRSNLRLTQAMVRSTVTSGVCMFLNLASIPIQYIFATQFNSVFDILYDIGLLMQLLAVIAVFKNWRTRFFPWRLLVLRSSIKEVRRSVTSVHNPTELPSSPRAGTTIRNTTPV